VGLSWLLCGLVGSLPYIFSGVLTDQYHNWQNLFSAAIFESVSGFTTTGASIFVDPESLPRAILFWRSLTHWLGGMGIVVLFVAILGSTGAAGKFLVSREVSGPLAESARPRIRQTALLLWKIYLSLSLLEVIILILQGMPLFDSLCHTFGTMATGGFSIKNQSIGHYENLHFELTIIAFMILAGINFNLYAACIHGRGKALLRNKELRIFLIILAVVTLVVSLDLMADRDYSFASALRAAGFQVVSILTTTGYGTDDYNEWPTFTRWILIILMFIGGSAGSTAGGIKIIRIMLFVRLAIHEIERTFRPNVVRPLRVNNQPVDEETRRTVAIYIGHILIIFFTSTLFLMILHNNAHLKIEDDLETSQQSQLAQPLDLESAFSAVLASLTNIGPGLNMVGPTQNYAFFSAPAKLFLSLLMVLGRLEIMVILCLFVPAFWRKD